MPDMNFLHSSSQTMRTNTMKVMSWVVVYSYATNSSFLSSSSSSPASCHAFDRTRLQTDAPTSRLSQPTKTSAKDPLVGRRLTSRTALAQHSTSIEQHHQQQQQRPWLQDMLRRGVRRSVTMAEGVSSTSMRGGSSSNDGNGRFHLNGADRLARNLCIACGWVVSVQAVLQAADTYRQQMWEFATKWLSRDSIEAMKSVRRIVTTLPDYGVESDLLRNYTPQDIIASMYALSKLQKAAQRYERQQLQRAPCHDKDLVRDLARYSRFAAAAYGWTMDLATSGRLHRGDMRALTKMTGIEESDFVKVNLDATVSVPAHFLARDHANKSIVLSIRGTYSAHDVLTDLCCRTVDFCVGTKLYSAHEGMLEGARGIQEETEYLVKSELAAHPDYKLKIVGHSLGGGVAAILARLLSHSLSVPASVYTFGAPCVSPTQQSPPHDAVGKQPDDDDNGDHRNDTDGNDSAEDVRIYSVLNEGDPFCCISLGHFADVTAALSELCEKPDLRAMILMRTDGRVEDMDDCDLRWCLQTMNQMRRRMKGEKLHPPGNLLYLSKDQQRSQEFQLEYVPPEFFDELVIGPKMFDFAQHIPRLYESRLRNCLESLDEYEDEYE